ncbi:alkaline phosphatase family protein [Paenibacillus lautus]|uniref:alkaline phosphatase family protein n=1 Tax=Paenibacillus lautus TaxID=1401 RepID=UPI001C0F7B0C|nr:alkaline phosphatase family protein [Paenibacillus lautus]MBU5345884.1 alkaline phosphatase family protein [Paenibacillus lautus]
MQIKRIIIIMLSLVLITIMGCQQKPAEQDLLRVKSEQGATHKKVIFLMVDSLMSQAIDKGISQKQLPTFQYLIEHGQYHKDMVSSFPTMSVTIDSTMLTGKYPNGHGVPGLLWYSSDDKKMINYGTGPMEILRQGVNPVLTDALIHLNGKHLNPNSRTIYEELARLGLKSGSINGLIYRGTTEHTLTIPDWIQGPTSLQKQIKVKGPDFLTLGALSNPLEGTKGTENLPDDLTDRMGLNNKYAIQAVNYLIQANKLPDFLYVYLPDMDQELHKKGPSSLEGVKKVDQQLQSVLHSFGSREKALNEAVFVIAGDSGMTQLLSAEQRSVIDMPAMLKGISVLKPGEEVKAETEVALAVNETMAYVYNFKPSRSLRSLADILSKDDRIDFVAWKENEWIHAIQGATSKQLRYKANGNFTDRYKQSWTVKQNPEVLDLKLNANNQTLDYGQYPDVLERLAGALNSHKGEFLVVTAKPGYELADRSSPTHEGGGGHGSIRQTESLVPLIIVGTNEKPAHLRMVDLKAYLLDLLTNHVQKTK